MSDMELILNMLAESTPTEISKNENPNSFAESRAIAMRGGKAAKEARLVVEQQTGKSVITSQNASQLNTAVTKLIEGSDEITGTDKMKAVIYVRYSSDSRRGESIEGQINQFKYSASDMFQHSSVSVPEAFSFIFVVDIQNK